MHRGHAVRGRAVLADQTCDFLGSDASFVSQGDSASASIDGNASSSPITASCPGGYSIVSVDCNTTGDFQLATVGWLITSNMQSGTCYIRNNSGIGRPMDASVRCCRSRAY